MYKEKISIELVVEEPLGLFPNDLGVKPFLKWAGGKTQLLSHLHKYAPLNFNKYIEPFIGGGAMFFSLNAENSIISDSNEELVITYRQIQTNVDQVISHLKTFRNEEDFYYQIRQLNPIDLELSFRAARLIYLNKTCFNGLYRVNKKGYFNVPYGKGSGNFLHEEVLKNANEYLQNTIIAHGDYLAILNKEAKPGDFIFLDLRYSPLTGQKTGLFKL